MDITKEGPIFENLPRRRAARQAAPAAFPAAQAPESQGAALVWNVLTVLVWLITACAIMAFLSIYKNPASAFNPFYEPQAPTLAAVVVIPTGTASPQPTQGTEAASPTPTLPPPTATSTATLQPTETATPGPSPTPTVYSLYPFIQRGEIKVIDGATFHDRDQCNLWVAGQAYDIQGAPMVGITVMLGGGLDYKSLYQLSLTGTALQYGQAGYEFTIADHPIKSSESVYVQLFDQAMIPLSGRVYFDTTEDCSQNLVLISFRQVH